MAALAGFDKRHNFVLVLRDADTVAAALRQALDEAPAEQRPGLERAVALVESTAAATEGLLRARWVRARLADAGFTGAVDSIAAVKALRRAEPKLSLLAAVELQKAAMAHPEDTPDPR
ncbi:hypothetical protein ACIQPQ_16590 [Streptomyces sp. NPDC091281]|uniref:hypothetical protein n=1 Tax=Streptomyces sp. NPDC091281 TaxID=3365985 RepID=UPI0038125C74